MDSIRSKSAQYRILRNGQKKSSKYFSPIPCTQERTKVDTLHQLLFPFCNDATKNTEISITAIEMDHQFSTKLRLKKMQDFPRL